MLVRDIALRNIRSYNDGTDVVVRFPEGVVLVEGDIGSGKSTLLYALEFALFGFSDMKGGHLLSETKDEGRVTVTFESEGREYVLERRLKRRGDDVSHGECYIEEDGRRARLSPSDLKERVISILGFNEPTHPRAESLVYRYAVFTPQEQMRDIVTQRADDRLHVVRRVLGVQGYQAAAENSLILERRLDQMAHGLRKASEELEHRREELAGLSTEVARLDSLIPSLESDEKRTAAEVARLQAELQEMRQERMELGVAVGTVDTLRRQIGGEEDRIEEDQRFVTRVESEIEEDESLIERLGTTSKPAEGSAAVEARREEHRDRLAYLRAQRKKLAEEAETNRELVSKGVCPVCRRPVPESISLQTGHLQEEIGRIDKETQEVTLAAALLQEQLSVSRGYEKLEADSATASKRKSSNELLASSRREAIFSSRVQLSDLRKQLAEAESKEAPLKRLSAAMETKERELDAARRDNREASLGLERARTERSDKQAESERVLKDVRRMEKDKEEARRLADYQDWLAGYFRPTVSLVERQTMAHAAARFNDHFQRFFSALVEDPDMTVRVKEDFSPIFERQGFEQEYGALSGGERTSMALAYRLSLNCTVREGMSSQPDLMILDEPTDGFSREEIQKMRGLLETLGSRQVILVSHERELEPVADHVLRIEKTNGTSHVVGAPSGGLSKL